MSTLRVFSFVLLATAMFALVAANREMKMGNSSVKISDSGEMEFRRSPTGMANANDDAHPVKIKMDEIVQVDKDGKELVECTEGSASKPGMGWIKNALKKAAMKDKMKKFRGFANQTFNFDAKKSQASIPHGGAMKAAMQKFKTALADGIGEMAIELALPEGDGDIDIDGEKQKLKKGDMKFNIEMSEWTWCDNAAFLDVYMKLASKKKPTKRQARSKSLPVSYDLGGNKTVSFSGKFKNDSGAWFDMEDGFPKVDPNDPTRIIVRFPRFDQTLVYDPSVSGDTDAGDDSSAANGVRSLSAMLIAMATTAVYATLK